MNERDQKKLEIFTWELNQLSEPARNFLEYAIINIIPERFWWIPPSSSGRHHPICTRRKGGLVIHTKRVVYFAHQLIEAQQLPREANETIIVAAVLHDIAKKDKYTDYETEYVNHPVIAAELLEDHKGELKRVFAGDNFSNFFLQVCELIKYHMGPWTPDKIKKPLERYTIEEKTLYFADYLASRKMSGTPVDDIDIPEELFTSDEQTNEPDLEEANQPQDVQE